MTHHPDAQLFDIGDRVQHSSWRKEVGVLCIQHRVDNSSTMVGGLEVGVLN